MSVEDSARLVKVRLAQLRLDAHRTIESSHVKVSVVKIHLRLVTQNKMRCLT